MLPQACREELRLTRDEKAEAIRSLLVSERMLIDRERRVTHLENILDRKEAPENSPEATPNVLRELTEQVAELTEQLVAYQGGESPDSAKDQEKPESGTGTPGTQQELGSTAIVGEEDFVQADIDGDGLIRWVCVKID